MSRESFETRRFQAKTAALVDSANSIIAEYQARGLIRGEVEEMLDVDAWNSAKAAETANRALLEAASGKWALVEKFLMEARS